MTTVTYDQTEYTQLTDTVWADAPYSVRIQVGKELTPDQAEQLAGLVGYAYAKTGGERGNGFVQDSPNSIIYFCDTTKGRAYNKLETFFEDVKVMAVEGSPQRKTKENTRLIEGLGDIGDITFFADSVYDSTPKPPVPLTAEGTPAPGIYTVDEKVFRVGKTEAVSTFMSGKWRPQSAAESRDSASRIKARGHKTPTEQVAALGRASGVCLVCGRALSDPDAIERGIGSKCVAKV